MPRHHALTVPLNTSRFLRGRLLKQPPPWYQATIETPPGQSIIREWVSQDPDSESTSPPSPSTPSQLRPSGPPRPLALKFEPEDTLRKRFYDDHPFEAYRSDVLYERGDQVDVLGGRERWREIERNKGGQGSDGIVLMRQGGRNVVPEDCISYASHLNLTHRIPLTQSYRLSLSQYRTLRSEHKLSTLSATLEAKSYGALFPYDDPRLSSPIARGFEMERKSLEGWKGVKPGLGMGSGKRSSREINFGQGNAGVGSGAGEGSAVGQAGGREIGGVGSGSGSGSGSGGLVVEEKGRALTGGVRFATVGSRTAREGEFSAGLEYLKSGDVRASKGRLRKEDS